MRSTCKPAVQGMHCLLPTTWTFACTELPPAHLQRLNANRGAGALALDVHHLARHQALAAHCLADLGQGRREGSSGV